MVLCNFMKRYIERYHKNRQKVQDMEENILGKELKRLRKERKLSQEEVAECLQIRRQTYSHYETGRIQPPARKLCALAAIFEIPMSGLLQYMDVGQEEEESVVLSVQENQLLSCYRKLDEKSRKNLLEYVKMQGAP